MIDPVSAVGGSSYLSTDDPTKEVVRMLLVLILMATAYFFRIQPSPPAAGQQVFMECIA